MATAFIVRPFGTQEGIDFNRVEHELIGPALAGYELIGRATDDTRQQNRSQAQTLHRLLTADVVIVDISLGTASIMNALGVGHGLRHKQPFLICSSRAVPPLHELPFHLRTDQYLTYDAANPAAARDLLTKQLRQALLSPEENSPRFQLLPAPAEPDQEHLLVVPEDFQLEVQRAMSQPDSRAQWSHLKLLYTEVQSFPWRVEGLRIIGRAQFGKRAYQDACQTWEDVRDDNPLNKEADLWLGSIYQQLSQLPSGEEALKANPGAKEQENGSWVEKPPHVLLFTGHRLDAPTRNIPRFPAAKEAVARQAIEEAIRKEVARINGPVLGIAGGASGGDILFHEVCAELRVATLLYLVMPKQEYIQESVEDSGPAWVERFNALYNQLPRRELGATKELPQWLQGKPEYGIWQRNNLWNLYNALALGSRYATLIALWDGEAPAQKPGGTQDMVAQTRKSGAKVILLETKKIFALK